jgi:hypothetical protein
VLSQLTNVGIQASGQVLREKAGNTKQTHGQRNPQASHSSPPNGFSPPPRIATQNSREPVRVQIVPGKMGKHPVKTDRWSDSSHWIAGQRKLDSCGNSAIRSSVLKAEHFAVSNGFWTAVCVWNQRISNSDLWLRKARNQANSISSDALCKPK